jgi:hypothetical protein
LDWNPNVLSIIEAKSMLGVEANPGGVLHESGSDILLVVEDSASQTAGTIQPNRNPPRQLTII